MTIVMIVFAALTILSLVLHIVRPNATITQVVDKVTPIIEKTVTDLVIGSSGSSVVSAPLHLQRHGLLGDLPPAPSPWDTGYVPMMYAGPRNARKQEQAILPFVSTDDKGNPMPCPKGKIVEVRARPQGVIYRMTSLVPDDVNATDFVVHDIMVGPTSQFAQRRHPVQLKALLSEPFIATPAQTGMDIVMHVEYVGVAETADWAKVFRVHAVGDNLNY